MARDDKAARDQFMRQARQVIQTFRDRHAADVNSPLHPLDFLLDSEGNWVARTWYKPADAGKWGVQAGHTGIPAAQGGGRMALEDAFRNHRYKAGDGRNVLYPELPDAAIDIGGLPVELRTAASMQYEGRLPPGTIETARRVSGWSKETFATEGLTGSEIAPAAGGTSSAMMVPPVGVPPVGSLGAAMGLANLTAQLAAASYAAAAHAIGVMASGGLAGILVDQARQAYEKERRKRPWLPPFSRLVLGPPPWADPLERTFLDWIGRAFSSLGSGPGPEFGESDHRPTSTPAPSAAPTHTTAAPVAPRRGIEEVPRHIESRPANEPGFVPPDVRLSHVSSIAAASPRDARLSTTRPVERSRTFPGPPVPVDDSISGAPQRRYYAPAPVPLPPTNATTVRAPFVPFVSSITVLPASSHASTAPPVAPSGPHLPPGPGPTSAPFRPPTLPPIDPIRPAAPPVMPPARPPAPPAVPPGGDGIVWGSRPPFPLVHEGWRPTFDD
jgi:hypothetical protein